MIHRKQHGGLGGCLVLVDRSICGRRHPDVRLREANPRPVTASRQLARAVQQSGHRNAVHCRRGGTDELRDRRKDILQRGRTIDVAPAPGKDFVFANEITGGAIPKEYIKPIEEGIREALERGVLAGYPVVDVKIRLWDGSFHEVDSSEMAFKIAGSMAFKEACAKARPRLLEPIMDVEVVVPEVYMGDIIGDLSARRGRIGGMFTRSQARVIAASVPLSEMFGYATRMRSISQGRAVYSMQFSRYETLPQSVAEEIVAKVKG